MRVLVTGAEGFVARHVIEELRSRDHHVTGTVLDARGMQELGVLVYPLDVTDADACAAILRDSAPTAIVHLAAVSSVAWSFHHPSETFRVNVEGTRNLLGACARLSPPPKALIVGSAEEYGPNDGRSLPELPVSRLRPVSPYAESKVAVERFVENDPSFRAIVVRTRSFPHVGPGQRSGFFVTDVAAQLADIARGERSPLLRVGNIDVVRDYTDVRDVARAYVLLLEHGVPGEVYNVCTGRGVRLSLMLRTLLALSGATVEVVRDPLKGRPSEITVLVGDPSKLRRATGWEPGRSLERSLADVVAWRKQGVPRRRGEPGGLRNVPRSSWMSE